MPAPGHKAPPLAPLGLGQKLAYGCGDLSSNLVWGLMLSYLMYYYTDIYVIPAATVAWLLLVPRVFDAFADPMVGYLVDRSGGRHVTRLMGLLAVPFGLATFLCFLPLPLGPQGKLAWAFGSYLLLGGVYSAVNTPYGVLSNMMAIRPQERVSLNAFRLAGCQLGQIIVASLTLPAIAFLGGGGSLAQQQHGITWLAALLGAGAAALWLVTWRSCRVRRALPLEVHGPVTLLRTLIGNRRWHLSNVLTYLNFTVFCSEGGLTIHYTRFVLGHPARDASLLLTLATVSAFAGVLVIPAVTRRFGIRHTYLGLLLWEMGCLAGMALAGSNFTLFATFMALQYLANGPVSPLCLAMLSEAVDEGRARTGIAAAGLAFSSNTLISKVATGVAGFAIATFLAQGHYRPDLAAPSAQLVGWLKLGFMGLPAAAITIAFLLVWASRPDHHQLADTHD
ncbi:MAG TPA: glycoside-pentoside-hexuronide (GPH):cation symporter [Novosphingobium sp.]|nr:glycoside-pentoside-hexuronide (GPH):cation symporter [Novosphingobium sp.]